MIAPTQKTAHFSDGITVRLRTIDLGVMDTLPREPGSVEIEDFEIEKCFRNQGVGSMVLRSAVAHLKQEGHAELFSEEVGPAALYARRSVLGENMQFYEHRDPNRTPIDRTFDEALRHAHQVKHDQGQRERYEQTPTGIGAYGVSLDLASVDTSKWILPAAYLTDEYDSLNSL